jgi:hypothetical protein
MPTNVKKITFRPEGYLSITGTLTFTNQTISADKDYIFRGGMITGNITNIDGYCIANNKMCLDFLKENNTNLKDTKIFGSKIPSMETFFHSYMKKYTAHLHFTLSNIFFCSNINVELTNFKYNYSIIQYEHPGILLAKEIQDKYTKETDIYFLKNHGIIITSESIEQLIELYEYIYDYFNQSLNYEFDDSSFKINKHYRSYNKNKIIRKYHYPVVLLKNIIYCFPDLAIFAEKIGIVDKVDKINGIDYNIIILNDNVYLCADNITKLYGLIEIIDSYKILAQSQLQSPLTSVDSKYLKNMEQEKLRKIYAAYFFSQFSSHSLISIMNNHIYNHILYNHKLLDTDYYHLYHNFYNIPFLP